jgi:hypothetical protein
MSYEYESDDNDFEQSGPKALREALEKANKALAAEQAKAAELQKSVNEFKLTSVLAAKNVPANIQRWMKRDGVEPTAEAVEQWLTENGEDFGWKPGGTAEKPEGQESAPEEAPAVAQSVLTPEDIAAQQRIQQVTASGVGQTVSTDQVDAQVAAVESALGPNADFNEVVKALAAQGIPVQSHFG